MQLSRLFVVTVKVSARSGISQRWTGKGSVFQPTHMADGLGLPSG